MRTRHGRDRDAESLLHVGIAFLDGALDDLIAAKLVLVPSVRSWDSPSSALCSALCDDVEASRGRRHLQEIVGRLRELAPHLDGHLDELWREVRDYEARCAGVGWAVAMECSTRVAIEVDD